MIRPIRHEQISGEWRSSPSSKAQPPEPPNEITLGTEVYRPLNLKPCLRLWNKLCISNGIVILNYKPILLLHTLPSISKKKKDKEPLLNLLMKKMLL